MNRIIFVLLAALIGHAAFAQSESAQALAKGKTFMQQGDYSNAVIVLYLASQKDPANLELAKSLSLCYYYQHNYQNALELILQQLDKADADDQCFLIASDIYQQTEQLKDAEKILKKGLKRFPDSGPLYCNLGELQYIQKKPDAISTWEKGLEKDPSFGKNYYNAARYYFKSGEMVKAMLLAEIYVNMEPMSQNTPEVKSLILKGWRQLFSPENAKSNDALKGFYADFLKCLQKHADVLSSGVNTESLTMLRSLFVIHWFKEHADEYPFQLFSFHQQLLREGYFESYQQWLFGTAENLLEFKKWTYAHSDEYAGFMKLQQNKIFKITSRQIY